MDAIGGGRVSSHATLLIKKLESIAVLSEEEKRVVNKLRGTIKTLAAHEDVVSEGDRPSHVCLLIEGFACRYKIVENGKRQIMSFHLPGDIPDLQSLYLKEMDHSLGAVVPSRVLLIPHEIVLDIFTRYPSLGAIFWRDTLIDAAIFREWMVGIGRRDAYTRIAHLLCEVIARMRAIGFVENNTCELPLTQTDIADSLGLSTVHVNRTLQQLRSKGLLELDDGSLKVRDWEGLQEAGEFDPTYLHFKSERRDGLHLRSPA